MVIIHPKQELLLIKLTIAMLHAKLDLLFIKKLTIVF